MRETLYDYCERMGETELLRQWHPARNGALTPGDLSYGSKRKVWWQCEKGHEWQAVVHTRTGSGCGCSAVVLGSLIWKKFQAREVKRVLFMATGALLSSTSSQQGETIPGIAHAIVLEADDLCR